MNVSDPSGHTLLVCRLRPPEQTPLILIIECSWRSVLRGGAPSIPPKGRPPLTCRHAPTAKEEEAGPVRGKAEEAPGSRGRGGRVGADVRAGPDSRPGVEAIKVVQNDCSTIEGRGVRRGGQWGGARGGWPKLTGHTWDREREKQ